VIYQKYFKKYLKKFLENIPEKLLGNFLALGVPR
jgi:hypothetical protein